MLCDDYLSVLLHLNFSVFWSPLRSYGPPVDSGVSFTGTNEQILGLGPATVALTLGTKSWEQTLLV